MFNNFVSEKRNQYKVTDVAKFVRKAKYQKWFSVQIEKYGSMLCALKLKINKRKLCVSFPSLITRFSRNFEFIP